MDFFGVFLEEGRWKIQKMRGVEMGDPKMGGRDKLGNFFGRERYIIMLHKM